MNIDDTQSLAVRSRRTRPVVFDDPEKFARNAFFDEKPVLGTIADAGDAANPTQRYLLDVARSAQEASALVREAWAQVQDAGRLRHRRRCTCPRWRR